MHGGKLFALLIDGPPNGDWRYPPEVTAAAQQTKVRRRLARLPAAFCSHPSPALSSPSDPTSPLPPPPLAQEHWTRCNEELKQRQRQLQRRQGEERAEAQGRQQRREEAGARQLLQQSPQALAKVVGLATSGTRPSALGAPGGESAPAWRGPL